MTRMTPDPSSSKRTGIMQGRIGEILRYLLTFRTPVVIKEGDPHFAKPLVEAEAARVRQSRLLARYIGIPVGIVAVIVITLVTPISGYRSNNLRVVGTVSEGQRLKIAETLSAIEGQPLVFINTEVVASLLAKTNPEIKDIAVERDWLTGLRVHANQRVPMMIVESTSGVYFVDDQGYILDSLVEGYKGDVTKYMLMYPIVTTNAPIGVLNPIQNDTIMNAVKVIQQAPPELKDYVTHWYANGNYGLRFTLKPISYGDLSIAHVEFGKAEKISEKFSVIHNLLKQLAGQGMQSVTMDVTAPSNPVIREQIEGSG